MQFACILAVILACYIATAASVQPTGSKNVPRRKVPPRPTKPPGVADDVHRYNILLTKVVHNLDCSTYIGKETDVTVKMYNDTMPVISGLLHITKDLPADMQVRMTGYIFTPSNQWVLVFDQGLQVYCDYAENNVSFMQNLMKASNFTECPLKKGVYSIFNMVVDEKEFPPGLPDSKFRLDGVSYINGKWLGVFHIYADISQKDDLDD